MMPDRKRSPDRDFERAYRQRASDLRAIAGRAGYQEAADLVQDAALRAVEAGRKADIRNPVHYLFRITRNLVTDRLRSRVVRAAVLVEGEPTDPADQTPNVECAVIARERLKLALAIINSMPEKRRAVFTMHRFDQLNYAEIARRLGISIKTVEKHMARAMLQLACEIDGKR